MLRFPCFPSETLAHGERAPLAAGWRQGGKPTPTCCRRGQMAKGRAVGLTGNRSRREFSASLWPCSLLHLADVAARSLHASCPAPRSRSEVALGWCPSRSVWGKKGTYEWNIPSCLSPVVTRRTWHSEGYPEPSKPFSCHQKCYVRWAIINRSNCCLKPMMQVALAVLNEKFLQNLTAWAKYSLKCQLKCIICHWEIR